MAQQSITAGTAVQMTLAPGTPITIAGTAICFGYTAAGANAFATAPSLAIGNNIWPGIFINFGTLTLWVGVFAASGTATINYPS